MNFALILFLLTIFTGIFWFLDVFILAPSRKAQARSELAAFDRDNKEALSRGVQQVVSARHAIEVRIKERPRWLEYTAGFFPIILFIFVLRSFVIEPFRIPSGSMMPTLVTGDMILVNKYAYGLRIPVLNTKFFPIGEPKRGEVVVFRYPPNTEIDYIKRIVGLPGDKVSYMDKKLTINGELVHTVPDGTYYDDSRLLELDQYKEQLGEITHRILIDRTKPGFLYELPSHNNPQACTYTSGGVECTVPPGHYFVMGDNRDNSEDSRYWGFVPEENMVGRAFFIWMNLASPSRIGSFE